MGLRGRFFESIKVSPRSRISLSVLSTTWPTAALSTPTLTWRRPGAAPGHTLRLAPPSPLPTSAGPAPPPGPAPPDPPRGGPQVHPAPGPTCRALLSDRGSAALIVLGFLSLPPLLVLASAARARLIRHLRLLLPSPAGNPGSHEEQFCAWA